MKLFIITAPDDITEASQYAESLASLAVSLDNEGFAIRAIEELREGAVEPRSMPHFTAISASWPKK